MWYWGEVDYVFYVINKAYIVWLIVFLNIMKWRWFSFFFFNLVLFLGSFCNVYYELLVIGKWGNDYKFMFNDVIIFRMFCKVEIGCWVLVGELSG